MGLQEPPKHPVWAFFVSFQQRCSKDVCKIAVQHAIFFGEVVIKNKNMAYGISCSDFDKQPSRKLCGFVGAVPALQVW